MEVKKTQQKPWVSLVVAIIALFLALIIAKVETINALELDFWITDLSGGENWILRNLPS